jgi:calcineurin-like phosphoesterase family protein
LRRHGAGLLAAVYRGIVDMKIWFTADTHFGHSNIIKHCSRPFADADEMDAALITTWNAVIQPKDIVWHLGDFAFRSAKNPGDYLKKLYGAKQLVVGNVRGAKPRAGVGIMRAGRGLGSVAAAVG